MGYLLQDGIAGLIIEEEKWFYYLYLGNWTSFKKLLYIVHIRVQTTEKFQVSNGFFVVWVKDLGGYLLQNGIADLIIEAEK